MMFENPFPESCSFSVEEKSLLLNGLHPLEVSIGNTFLSSDRRAEFFTGRRCAHAAMKSAGYPPLPVLRNRNRSPVWPLKITGSITHGASLAAAIIGKRHTDIIGLGIDIEDLSREIRTDISRYTLTPWEIEKWSVSSVSSSREARIIFSIKETIYKCFFPVHCVYLGFQDAEITEIEETGFKARLLKNPFKTQVAVPMELEGSLAFKEKIVFSALLIERYHFL